MSDFPTRQEPGSLAQVEPLTSKTADGKPYERSASVQAEISRTLALHSPEWLRQAPDLQNETLLYLIRRTRDRDQELYGGLMQVLSKRIHRLARSRLRAFDKFTAEELILQVEIEIIEVVLAKTPSLRSEFLEIAFAAAVIERTWKAIRAHKRSPAGDRGDISPGATDEDSDEIERPIELVPDGRAGPEAIALESAQWDKVRALVKDPRQADAVILHFRDEMPIRSSDSNELDLMRYFNASEGQVRYLLRAGKKVIRRLFGGQKDDEK
jgi:hypothetical protein